VQLLSSRSKGDEKVKAERKVAFITCQFYFIPVSIYYLGEERMERG